MSMEEWVDDVNSTDDDDEDSGGSSLFQDNFRRMVENGEVDSLNAQTIQTQIDQIDDKALLAEAADVDDRDDCVEAYQARLGELNTEALDEEADEGNDSTGDEDASTEAASSGSSSTPEADTEEPADESADGPDETEEADDGPESDDSDEQANALAESMADHGDDDFDPDRADDDEETSETAESTPQSQSDETSDDADDEVVEEATDDAQDDATDTPDPDEVDSDETDDEPAESGGAAVSVTETTTDADDSDSDLPDVDVGAIAPNAQTRDEVAKAEAQHTLLVWGPEGSGKSHIAHSAPEPVCYIDTEGKADELASKFDKKLFYWTPDDYQEAKAAMERALDVLAEYREHGVTGTIVVDSMTVMWEWAKIDYAKFAYQTDDLTEVSFDSQLEGSQDWAKIKARHNDSFRSVILNAPYHVVMTAGQKEDYNAVMEGADGKPMTDDGEKRNRYAVKDVVRTRVDDEGDTVADLHKAAKTKYSFLGLKWPEWTDIYEAVDQIAEAEQTPGEVDITGWPFDVVEGQPVSEGADEGGDDDN